ncbi:MAG: 30S ribosomal protein S3 [Patescibacteria group bacterium]|nr:30S ribosomal protein S3 [Patescibacteria group bacterium]
MGQKVNPKIFRIPLIQEWQSKWFAKLSSFRKILKTDISIRKFLKKRLKNCGLGGIEIERVGEVLKVIIKTAKPGLVIGRGGVDIEKLKKEIENKFLEKGDSLEIQVQEIASPHLSASVVLETIIADLEKRVPFRRVAKRAIEQVKKAGAAGVKIVIKGRLDGVEIARAETFSWGKMPLHSLRSNIDYSRGTAFTLYGAIGVKVWIYKGEVF